MNIIDTITIETLCSTTLSVVRVERFPIARPFNSQRNKERLARTIAERAGQSVVFMNVDGVRTIYCHGHIVQIPKNEK